MKKKKYSVNNIKNKLDDKKNELLILEEELNLLDEKDPEAKLKLENKKIILEKEIIEHQNSLNKITIKTTRLDQEFDGFFFSSKEIQLENDYGDNLKIPPNKPIIIEVKNHSNYTKILDNIRKKKGLLNSLRLNEKQFYFIGILRNLGIDKTVKDNITKKYISKNLENMIIIYAKENNFLGVPLYEPKIEKKQPENLENIFFGLKKQMERIENQIGELVGIVRELKKGKNS